MTFDKKKYEDSIEDMDIVDIQHEIDALELDISEPQQKLEVLRKRRNELGAIGLREKPMGVASFEAGMYLFTQRITKKPAMKLIRERYPTAFRYLINDDEASDSLNISKTDLIKHLIRMGLDKKEAEHLAEMVSITGEPYIQARKVKE